MNAAPALVGLIAAALLTGCASLSPRCNAGMTTRTLDTLYFGTARADAAVSADEWQDFVARSVTPRFPDGLTTWRADGQWRGASGEPEREQSHVLQIVHDGDTAQDAALRALIADYRTRFAQESVLRTSARVCVGFGKG